MTLYDENWKEADYTRTDMIMRHKLTRNNLVRKDALPVEFFDYHANEEVPCFPYFRTLQHCINLYGLHTNEFMASKTCLDAANWFPICVNNHDFYTKQRKYNASVFVNTGESNRRLTLNDVI